MYHRKRIDLSKPGPFLGSSRRRTVPENIEDDCKEVFLGTKDRVRLEQLNEWHRVRITCYQCRHKADLKPAAFKSGRSGRELLDASVSNLRCTSCDNRFDNAWKIIALPRNY